MTTIRDATASDMAAILAMNNEAVPAVNPHTEESLAELADIATHLVVVDQDDAIAGFLLMLDGPGRPYASQNYAWFSERYDDFFYVDRIVVDTSRFRGGFGRALYEWAIETGAGTYPVLCAEVNTRPMNQRSIDFHLALGFEAVGNQDTEGGAKSVVMLARPLT